ncbi:hypothetical protein Tamer19_71370 [Cupriavidus sp. TA19]|uniref:hypothetical protein n=1 Tax=unclassified Cupriavidus TaxID=2640874 RepID=UPI00272948C5|nr:hypothetical protein [Cupriavidus sp. TA19]GLC97728.1 hypothetical protein Tamer19_71370 [Cupriavidus sp. TA19]
MLYKSLLSLSVAALVAAAPAFAGTAFHLVVPLTNYSAPPAEELSVTLNAGALAAARVGKTYSQSLTSFLQDTGDPAYSAANASWRVSGGALPPGLTLDPA